MKLLESESTTTVAFHRDNPSNVEEGIVAVAAVNSARVFIYMKAEIFEGDPQVGDVRSHGGFTKKKLAASGSFPVSYGANHLTKRPRVPSGMMRAVGEAKRDSKRIWDRKRGRGSGQLAKL